MSLMKSLARVAAGVMLAKGLGTMMQNQQQSRQGGGRRTGGGILGDLMNAGRGGAMQGRVQARIGRRRHCSLPVTDSMQRSNASLVKGLAMKLFIPARWPRSIISRVAVPVIRMKPMRWVLGF